MDEQRLGDDARLASDGDQDALQRLIVHCHETLHRAVANARAAALADRIDPDDILQQAYVAAFKALRTPAEGESAPPGSESAPASDESTSAGGGCRFESGGHFYKWLEAIALNRLRDAERALRRQKRDVVRERPLAASPTDSYPNLVQQLAASDPTPSRQIARVEAVAAVMSSLARLPDAQRDVIRWRFLEGVPFAEIAQRLGKSEDAIYMICHRGLKTLRGLMVSISRYLTKL